MPPDLLDQLQRILYFTNKVVDDIVGETEILEKTIPEMFEVMQKVANFSCDYVKRGRFGRYHLCGISQVLMIAERMVGGLARPEKIEENRQRVVQGDRRFRACSQRRDSLLRQEDW